MVYKTSIKVTTQQRFNSWLDNILETENPANDIVAYWFGIFETASGYETYLIGSKIFDENDSDWACNADFAPKNKYLLLGENGVEWEIILNKVKQFISDYFQTPTFKKSFLE